MSFKQTLFTASVEFNNGFFLDNLYKMLPIVTIKNYIFNSGKPIPFFGINDCIISLVPSDEILKHNKPRGVRTKNSKGKQSGAFGNSLATDFQTHYKNVHIRISSSKDKKSKFHITGTSSLEMASDVSERLSNYINTCDQMWKPFFMISINDRFALVNIIINIVEYGTEMLKYGDDILNERLKNINSYIEPYYSAVDLMLRFTLEECTFNEFKKKLYDICQICPGPFSIFHGQDVIKINRVEIYGTVNGGNTGFTNLVLSHICTGFINRGYNASFHNIKNPQLKIIIPILDKNGLHVYSSNGKFKAHTFNISEKGSFKLYSSGSYEEREYITKVVLNVISEIVNCSENLQSMELNYLAISSCQESLKNLANPYIKNNNTLNENTIDNSCLEIMDNEQDYGDNF
uniref:Uncharacterized protein n=1 Tax=viral metagenome TaxID=1070528 RepID=A0A6C0BD62_9ZZZZ